MSSADELSFFEIFEWHEWIVVVAFFVASLAMIISGIHLGIRHEHKRSRAYNANWESVKARPSDETVVISLTDTSQVLLLGGGPSLSPLKRKAVRALKLSRVSERSKQEFDECGNIGPLTTK
ncbi:hypothetical protein QR680_009369 [Steinernema hermaphroditum]|uniref:Uncharacterized protein n=1 Tax=Steinernema hermaphroditum TaxID=289476 RepID=A0AA39M9A7_9BILA|nr:hypothetical protein QR680_009369 [Steinernema hermaphroditum]